MGSTDWLHRLAPDVAATLRRFPLAVLLLAGTTLVGLALANEWIRGDEERWARAGLGLATAAVLATAGVLFGESRPRDRPAIVFFRYLLPLAVAGLFQVTATDWFVPYLLPAAAVFWLSVSPATRIGRGETRAREQDRFWWINQRAVVTGCVALVGLAMIAIGMLAIERALATLFGVAVDTVFYGYMLPVAVLLLGPLYWLSILPRPGDFEPREMDRPDFAAQATGFLGQFVLTPLLVVYALILLAYAAVIAVTGEIPQNQLGWMVLGFTVAGAANWLLLHPRFMRTRGLVRFFRRWWFWLTVVPLVLYIAAVYIRIEAYGFTPERIMLVLGGLWATGLSFAFLVRLGDDIRLIPALAGALLVVASIGPWNVEHGARLDQARRLGAMMQTDGFTAGSTAWANRTRADVARAAILYLSQDDTGREMMGRVLAGRGFEIDTATAGTNELLAATALAERDLDLPPPPIRVARDPRAVDVADTPAFLGVLQLAASPQRVGTGFALSLEGRQMRIYVEGAPITAIDLGDWIDAQDDETMRDPELSFAFEGVDYRLVLNEVMLVPDPGEPERRQFAHAVGALFAARRP